MNKDILPRSTEELNNLRNKSGLDVAWNEKNDKQKLYLILYSYRKRQNELIHEDRIDNNDYMRGLYDGFDMILAAIESL
jgi:hypothetical protein